MSSQALKQAIEPVSWKRTLGPASDIVDEPHCAQPHGGETPAVAIRDVVHLESLARERCLGLARRPALGDAARKDTMERGRAGAVLRLEQAVARAHGEAVGLAQGRAAHDLGVEEERASEALDELELLEVLFAEVRTLRAREQEELQHDGQHAVEMPRARGALELEAALALAHAITIAVGIDLLGAGQEDEVAARAAQQGEVRIERARVAGEVAGVVELRGIDE